MDCETSIHNLLEGLLDDKNAKPTDLPITLLKAITKDFSDDQQIGSGGFAQVYKGLLTNGGTVAVKKLSNSIVIDENTYNQEVGCLMRVRHKNIVRFLGYCADTQGKICHHGGKFVMADLRQRLLCFEYLPKGSLDQYISNASSGLKWRQRYQIIKGICEGLHYLHRQRIVHLDLKPANILLDEDMVPKITDFGLSRCFDENQSRIITSKLVGSMGYLAPEFFRGVITPKLDIYSLGVIILEILIGQKGYTPVECVLEIWRNTLNESLGEIMLEQVKICSEIGIQCIDLDPAKRPVIQNIIEMLNETESTSDLIENDMSTTLTKQHQSTGSDKVKQAEETIPALHGGTTTVASKKRSDASEALTQPDISMPTNYGSFPFHLQSIGIKVKLGAIPRTKSVPQGTSCTNFAVLVQVMAPLECTERSRINVDLIAVLDVARSFRQFLKMNSIKQAMMFVIDHLGPNDRLSIVTFNEDRVRRRTPLSVMTEENREIARSRIHELKAELGSDMVGAVREAYKILHQRGADNRSNRVGRIIVLSCNDDYKVLKEHISNEFPVETFGLSEDHNPTNMHFVAHTTSGIYSYVIEDIERIKDAFAMCIGGLTSVNALGVKIHLDTFEGVTISSIGSAAYHATINPDSQAATIHIDDLYAGEHKNFIVWLSIPEGSSERLMAISGCYRNPKISTEASIQLDSSEVAVLRPTVTASLDQTVCPEVAAEVIRFRLLKEVSDMMERPNQLKELQKIWNTMMGSEDGQAAPESTMSSLARDVDEMQRGLSSRGSKLEGTAFTLSWLTSNRLQRATTRISPSSLLTNMLSRSHAFRTNAMEDMLRDVDKETFADIQRGRYAYG